MGCGFDCEVLENDTFERNGWRFFGATFWTDFQFHEDPDAAFMAAAKMNDFKLIRLSPSMRLFTPGRARMLFRESKERLTAFLRAGDPRRSVVITHHAPSLKSVPEAFSKDPLSAAYASNLDALILEHKPCLWIHGHLHVHQDYLLGCTRVLANPRGYLGHEEATSGFNPEFVIDLPE